MIVFFLTFGIIERRKVIINSTNPFDILMLGEELS